MSDLRRQEGSPARRRVVLNDKEFQFKLDHEGQAAADHFHILVCMTVTNFKREALRQEHKKCLAYLARGPR